jgi:hypothetical protein
MDISKLLHPKREEHAFFSSLYATLIKINHNLCHKRYLDKFKEWKLHNFYSQTVSELNYK